MRRAAMVVVVIGAVAGAPPPALARPPAVATPPGVRWHRQVTFGGLGAGPAGLRVLVAATFRLPPAAGGCGGLLLPPRARDVIVRIEDFDAGPPALRARRGALRLGAIRSQREPSGRLVGVATSAARRHGHALGAAVTFGAPRPSRAAREAAARLLAAA
jgi:hypothetical protein